MKNAKRYNRERKTDIYIFIDLQFEIKHRGLGLKHIPATSPAPYRIYNIGNQHPTRLMDFLRTCRRHRVQTRHRPPGGYRPHRQLVQALLQPLTSPATSRINSPRDARHRSATPPDSPSSVNKNPSTDRLLSDSADRQTLHSRVLNILALNSAAHPQIPSLPFYCLKI